jgi:hypothetical protein
MKDAFLALNARKASFMASPVSTIRDDDAMIDMLDPDQARSGL